MKNALQKIYGHLYKNLQTLLRGSQGYDFYYHREQIRYEESVENNRLRYLTSFDKAA